MSDEEREAGLSRGAPCDSLEDTRRSFGFSIMIAASETAGGAGAGA